MTDHHPKHHLTHACTLLSSHLNQKLGPAMYKIKISNCNIRKPSPNAFQASFLHKLSLPAQLVFFCKVASFIILKSMSLFGVAQQLQNKINRRYKQSPTGFSCLLLTRPIQLPFTDTHSHLLAQPQSSNISQFTTRATIIVFHSKHLLFLSQNMAQKRVKMTVFKPNAYLRE